MKTVYRIYKIPIDQKIIDAKDLDIQDKYPLYAITNKKDLFNKFFEIRDKNRFIVRKSKMTKKEYVEFANSVSNQRLDEYSLLHCVGYTKSGRPDFKYINVVCTWTEREVIDCYANDGLSSINEDLKYDFFPGLFKKKYLEYLDKIRFIDFWKMYGEPTKYSVFFTEEESEKYLDYSYPEVSYDELNIFIYVFEDTMK